MRDTSDAAAGAAKACLLVSWTHMAVGSLCALQQTYDSEGWLEILWKNSNYVQET
jgi:hypothetical protein